MNFILHRVNTIERLRDCDQSYGVEVDIRSQGDALVIHHDPFVAGVSFEEWLAYYRHGTLILNVKEGRICVCCGNGREVNTEARGDKAHGII